MANMFDATKYYRFTNDVFGVGQSMGLTNSTSHAYPGMAPINTLESENWQIYYQQGAFFIRNFLYNSSYQLGVSRETLQPTMVPSSGEFNQQWLIENWGGSLSKMKLVNSMILFDNLEDSNILGCNPLNPNVTIVDLQSEASWLITLHTDAGSVTDDMLEPFSSIEIQPSGISGTPTPSSTTTPTPTHSVLPGGVYRPDTESSSFNGLDRTGVVVGVIAFVCLLVTGFFLYRRWKKHGFRWNTTAAGPVPTAGSSPSRRRRTSETVAEPPPAYHGRPDTSQPSTSFGIIPSYYEANRSTRTKQADEESIELPAYGMSPVEPRSAL